VRLERADRLFDQRHAVGQEQDALGPVAAHQHIGQGDDGAGLAAAGGHHQQGFALILNFKGFASAAHGPVLVVTLNDVRVDDRLGQLLATAAALNQQLQLLFLEEALHRTRWVTGIVPNPVLVAIGIKDDGALAVLGLQAIGIQLGLLLAHGGVLAGALGFYQCQGFAVIAPQHIVHKALALIVWHAADFNLKVLGIQLPASFFEQQVDEVVAGLFFGIVVGVGLGGVGLFGGGHLQAQLYQFIVQRGLG